MITIRNPETIYQAYGEIENGTFHGRWHFSFGEYYDPENTHFGTLRVFNDDTLSPGAVWPLHPHRDNEVVTYCAEGEFRHADERGKGGILKKGWVQHTTVGTGMWHSEINNLPDKPMRFIQMWFYPSKHGLVPSVEQKAVEKQERTNRFLPLVSNTDPGALRIVSDAAVYSCFLEAGKRVNHALAKGRGAYLYVIEGGPVEVNGNSVPALGAAKVTEERELSVGAKKDAELLLVDVLLI
ncbi:MAG: pirin family protein [Candidatus Methanoperedens sp.]|nr:pirin family protein [Candidatus Methanoperedens sp.]